MRYRTFPVVGAGTPGPVGVAVGFLNQDIKLDIAVAHFTASIVTVLLNACKVKE